MLQEPVFRRYVALGDSFTEGVGDPDPTRPNGLRGWADRVAETLATRNADFGYANLAVRGRMLGPIVDEQVEAAIALEPDLVTIYAGGNDLLRPKVDIDALVARYDEAVGKLTATGATVLVWTAFDTGGSTLFGKLRGRLAIYNELVRQLGRRHGATIVDFWGFEEYKDLRMWDWDRLHMSTPGHQNMAVRVLGILGIEHDIVVDPLGAELPVDRAAVRRADLLWARDFVVPWIGRRIRGTSSGDGIAAKRPTLAPIR